MGISVRVDSDLLPSLRDWLIAEDELRGRVSVVSPAPGPDRLGTGLPDTLLILAGTGVTTVIAKTAAAVLIEWLRRQTGVVSAKVTKPDGSVLEYRASNVRDLTASQVDDVVTELAKELSDGPSDA